MAKKFDFLSPGIDIREIDQSFIPAQVDDEGPIIIGRTRKGPANKPVKVSNLDDFVSVFGLPIPGGNGAQGDMWRDGNMTGPTYASYAAQAWLASEQSPITIVRLAGEQATGATDANGGKAGWELSGTASSVAAENSTAYGLFLVASGATDFGTGALAAVFYADSGYLALTGTSVADNAAKEEAGTFFQSLENNEYKLSVYNTTAKVGNSVTFNFNRDSSRYIRSVFNTNPQLVNDETTPSAQRKTYWLGETFAREVDTLTLSSSAGKSYALLLPLLSGSGTNNNWGDHREAATESQTGWVVSQKETDQAKLFKLKSLHVGNEIEKDYMIAIEQINAPSNPVVNPYGTFTVVIKNLNGQTIERYSGCNLNPSSPNYIAAKIGDQFLEWSDSDRRYRTYGDFRNQSDIVYVEVKQFVKDGAGQGYLPAGFIGPVRPKGFTLTSGSADAKGFGNVAATFAGAFIKGSGSVPSTATENMLAYGPAAYTASFNFPSIPLRQNGTEGGAANPYLAYYGIRPKISAASSQNDPDYVDYIRRLPVGAGGFRNEAGGDFENSFIFTLDDLQVTTGSNTVAYVSGAYDAGSAADQSFTKVSGTFAQLLDLGVQQFLMPLNGGFDGFDITEKEPFRNIPSTRNDDTSYLQYTLNKALDSVLDPEVVPANLLLMPGIRKPVITNRIIDVAESRKDVLAIIDLEGDYTPSAERTDTASEQDSLGSVTTAVSNIKTRNLNSSYASAFYPWVQISDNLNASQLLWIPPSIAALGALGRSQAQSELWFAPAGFNRGGLGSLGGSRGPKVTQARQRLDSRERDLLYDVNINPIATFPAEGLVIFGQKTLQADSSALDRINVRRLVLYLKARVSTISRNLLFDQNVESTWNRFKSQVNPILSDTRSKFGLSDYKLILDSTTTTADLIDRNIMYAKIYIKPARAIEYIVVDFVITKTGADFV